MIYPGEGPNLLPPSDPMTSSFTRPTPNTTDSSSTLTPNGPPRANPRTGALARRKSTRPGSSALPRLELHTSRPVFEKNRCTVTLRHGDPDRAIEEAGPKKRRRRYLVASDLSDESLYAIQWAIGTVLREGDEVRVASICRVLSSWPILSARLISRRLVAAVSRSVSSYRSWKPTLSVSPLLLSFLCDLGKLTSLCLTVDTDDVSKQAKITNQRERQAAALALARQTTALLERTRLNVRIYCQAIHAKVPRHMLIDMIDYLEPTLVLVGSRGLTKLKG